MVGFVVELDGSISGLRLLGVSYLGFVCLVLEVVKMMIFVLVK